VNRSAPPPRPAPPPRHYERDRHRSRSPGRDGHSSRSYDRRDRRDDRSGDRRDDRREDRRAEDSSKTPEQLNWDEDTEAWAIHFAALTRIRDRDQRHFNNATANNLDALARCSRAADALASAHASVARSILCLALAETTRDKSVETLSENESRLATSTTTLNTAAADHKLRVDEHDAKEALDKQKKAELDAATARVMQEFEQDKAGLVARMLSRLAPTRSLQNAASGTCTDSPVAQVLGHNLSCRPSQIEAEPLLQPSSMRPYHGLCALFSDTDSLLHLAQCTQLDGLPSAPSTTAPAAHDTRTIATDPITCALPPSSYASHVVSSFHHFWSCPD
jgi:hypothetical protein